MKKIYTMFLENKRIGTTRFEYADPPMGVVFGKIYFIDIDLPYQFLKNYCNKNKIEFSDYEDDKMILTRTISNLKVINQEGVEIKGLGNQISGMDSDVYELTLEGVSYPFYEKEFPHHVIGYHDGLSQILK